MFSRWQKVLLTVGSLVAFFLPAMVSATATGTVKMTVPANANGTCPSGYIYDYAASASTKCKLVSYSAGKGACASGYARDPSDGQCYLDSVSSNPNKTCPTTPPTFFDKSSNRCKVCYKNRGNPSPGGNDKNQPKKCP
jgi:hypothetical protein